MGRRRNKKISIEKIIISIIILLCAIIFEYINNKEKTEIENNNTEKMEVISFDLSTIPEYSNKPYVIINNNIPNFTEENYTTESFEIYSQWDSLGRSGVAFANVCKEIMPRDGEERGEIGNIKNLSRMGTKKI